MRRKIIKQGESYTITLPKKWVEEHKLGAKDEIDLIPAEDTLVLSPSKIKHNPKVLELTIKKNKDKSLRTVLSTAYRAGYDRITLIYDGKAAEINDLVTKHLLGFEVFEKKKHVYVIESVAEPSYDNFDNIVQKQFFILIQILQTIDKENVEELVFKVQRYDNFLRRSLHKKIFYKESFPFMWQFLTTLTQSARLLYHLYHYLHKNKVQFNKVHSSVIESIITMIRLLQKSYSSKKLEPLVEIKHIGWDLIYKKSIKLLQKENPVVMYYLIYTARLIYAANSPLTGVLQLKN